MKTKPNPMKSTFVTSACLGAIALAAPGARAATFGEDVAFLKTHKPVLVLSDKQGAAKVALVPDWQGRVMTSTAGGDAGASFGWINRELIASGKLQPHINVFGGEDRFWLGPEGGQFSIFFAKGAKFELSDWFTPASIDTVPYPVTSQSAGQARFGAEFALTNYSGTRFDVKVDRTVKLLTTAEAWKRLREKSEPRLSANGREADVKVVAYESENRLVNAGKIPGRKRRGCCRCGFSGCSSPRQRRLSWCRSRVEKG